MDEKTVPATFDDLDDLTGRRVTVMGLGGFGGGAAAVRFLAGRGASVRVSEHRSEVELADSVDSLADLPVIDWQFGGHDWSHFEDADFVVLNPAVPPHHPIVQQLEATRTPVTTEMSLFWQLNPGRVIAVTGSNGKSTTAALIHSMIEASGQRGWLGGNIGRSLLPDIERIGPEDRVVLELSSFQLHHLNRIRARPDIAVVTNFTPNHLDWHGTLEHYRYSKQAILRWQRPDDWCVINADDADVSAWERPALTIRCRSIDEDGKAPQQSEPPISLLRDETRADLIQPHTREVVRLDFRDRFPLQGRHNRFNFLMAASAALIAGVTPEDILRGAENFAPLPHRLEFVAEADGRKFYNDSIATTPESAIVGLQSFEEPVVLLAGGYDKQLDLTRFAAEIARGAKATVLLGQTGPGLAAAIHSCESSIPIRVATNLEQAFDEARKLSTPGDVVLLSPGCASYDWFENFADRGDQFRRLADRVSSP